MGKTHGRHWRDVRGQYFLWMVDGVNKTAVPDAPAAVAEEAPPAVVSTKGEQASDRRERTINNQEA